MKLLFLLITALSGYAADFNFQEQHIIIPGAVGISTGPMNNRYQALANYSLPDDTATVFRNVMLNFPQQVTVPELDLPSSVKVAFNVPDHSVKFTSLND